MTIPFVFLFPNMRLMMFKNLYFSSLFYLLTLKLIFIDAANFRVLNNCNYPVWAAAVPGGGAFLGQGQDWFFNTDTNSRDTGRIWARTICEFDGKGNGRCETGDCDGLLYCPLTSNGTTPITLAEYSFGSNLHFFDISLLDGFNVPMEFSGNSSKCTKVIKCAGDINGLCPTELRHPGGCHHPCNVFKNDQFCCTGRTGTPETCHPTEAYFKFFKNLCPNVYSYTYDDPTALFSCPTGTDYKVVFCP